MCGYIANLSPVAVHTGPLVLYDVWYCSMLLRITHNMHNTLRSFSFSFFIHMVFIIFTCHFSCLVTTDALLGASVNLLFLNLLTSEVGSSDGGGGATIKR